jgi:hypothetical protein
MLFLSAAVRGLEGMLWGWKAVAVIGEFSREKSSTGTT